MDFTKLQTLGLAIFGLVVLFAAIGLAAGSRKAQYKDTARTSVNVVVSMVLVAVALGAIGAAAFGGKILNQIGVNGSEAAAPAKPSATPTK